MIDHTFPLTAEGAAAAHQHLHDRKNFGQVVLVRGAKSSDDARALLAAAHRLDFMTDDEFAALPGAERGQLEEDAARVSVAETFPREKAKE